MDDVIFAHYPCGIYCVNGHILNVTHQRPVSQNSFAPGEILGMPAKNKIDPGEFYRGKFRRGRTCFPPGAIFLGGGVPILLHWQH